MIKHTITNADLLICATACCTISNEPFSSVFLTNQVIVQQLVGQLTNITKINRELEGVEHE